MNARAAQQTVCVWREELLPGSETFILNQCRALRGWSPKLSGLRTSSAGLDVRPDFTLERNRRVLDRANGRMYQWSGSTPGLHLHLRAASVVHAHFGPDGARLVRATSLARRPLIVTFHGYDATIPAATLGVDYSELFARAARLVAVSKFIGGRLVEAGAPQEKVTVLPVGIPLAPPRPRAGPREHLLFVGRLVPKKGCADLLQALSGMTDAPPLLVIGDGPLRDELERLARELRVRASFVGSRDAAYVAQAMARSIALCVPSKTARDGDQEGLGMVFLEAAAASLPVVSYASGGVPEAVLHGETGLLAPEGDVSRLAAHLDRVVRDQALAQRYGSAGRSRVQAEFDINIRTSQLEELYDVISDGARIIP